VNVRKAIQDKRVHAYHKVFVVWGRRPLEGEQVPTRPGPSAPAATNGPATAGATAETSQA